VVWRAALLGVTTTLLTLETFYALISLYVTCVYRSGATRQLGVGNSIVPWMTEIHSQCDFGLSQDVGRPQGSWRGKSRALLPVSPPVWGRWKGGSENG
jgi:hypothetical protein